MKDESLAERVLYRLIKKHISGTTMDSALEKAKELNGKNLPVSISFLSEGSTERAKARYVTTTYLELIRQISRLGLKASVQIPVQQIGSMIDEQVAAVNLEDIINAGNKYGVFVWCEIHDPDSTVIDRFEDAKGFGLSTEILNAKDYIRRYGNIRAIKVMCKDTDKKHESKEDGVMKEVEFTAKKVSNTTLYSAPEHIVWPLLKNGSKYKKSLVFEFQLGDSSTKIKKALKKGARVSMYVPFGKDWVNYAMTNVPEGYVRFLANKLLSETENVNGA